MYLRWTACLCAVSFVLYNYAPRQFVDLLTLEGISRLSDVERMIR